MKKLLLKLKYFLARLKGNNGVSGRVSNETKVDIPKADEKPPVVVIPDQPATVGHNLMFYPKAKIIKGMRSAGVYEHGHPVGAVVHFTAGRDENEQAAIDSLSWGAGQGYAFYVIGPTGQVYQSIPLNQWNSHCGQSYWPGLGSRLSNKLVGIEIACAGKLENGKSWFGKSYPADQIRNGFKKYTQAQEIALFELLRWLYENNPEVFHCDYILGHDEISPGRKNDPGHSLSIKMSELRTSVKQNKNPFI